MPQASARHCLADDAGDASDDAPAMLADDAMDSDGWWRVTCDEYWDSVFLLTCEGFNVSTSGVPQ